MIGARTPIHAIGALHYTVLNECRRSGLFSFFVFMFLVSLFFISNALYLMPFTFCYNMIMMHMYLYFDIMYDCSRAEIPYIQYSFTFVVVPKQYYLTLYVYLLLFHGKLYSKMFWRSRT